MGYVNSLEGKHRPHEKGPLQKILDIQMYPKDFLGIYFDGLKCLQTAGLWMSIGKGTYFSNQHGSRDLLDFLGSSLGAFGMRKPERIPGRTYCLDIGRRLLSLEIVTIQSIPRNHSYFLLRKLYEIVIGPHGSPFGDGKVAPVPI